MPRPAATEGPRWATWSILWACNEMARERSTWTSYAVAMARTRSWPLQPACWATANRGGMLSPGWEYSAARNVSWKSSSRTAAQLAQAAHSGDTQAWLPHPKTAAPGWSRWRRAWARALATGRRRREAAATPASSIRRLTTISVTSASTRTSSVATEASLQANCCSRGSVSELLCVRTSCSTTGPPSLGRSLRGPQICRRGASTWLGPVVPALPVLVVVPPLPVLAVVPALPALAVVPGTLARSQATCSHLPRQRTLPRSVPSYDGPAGPGPSRLLPRRAQALALRP